MIPLVLDSLMITGFVAAMMLLIEYLNVLSNGRWSLRLSRLRSGQYLLAALLGVTPGCLGAFTAVALYSHGLISFGAIVAAMVATSGDEAFVMLALVPQTALVLMGALFILAILSGIAVDFVGRRKAIDWPRCEALVLHAEESLPQLSLSGIREQWKECSAVRGVLTTVLAVFTAAIVLGQLGPPDWNWIRISLMAVSGASLFVVATSPDHFLEDHFWRHVARTHVPRVFLWTLGALLLTGHIQRLLEPDGASSSTWLMLLFACVVGLVPESGPHLIFITHYAQNAVPFSVLVASSVVQDGHGMLPMLAHSRKAFFAVKAVSFLLGLIAGALALSLGL